MIHFGGSALKPVPITAHASGSWSYRTQFDTDSETQFRGYLGRIWVHEHEIPDDESGLLSIDPEVLRQEYQDFVDHGRKQPTRGATLEEAYLLFMITCRTRAICIINSQQPIQLAGRIYHKALLEPRLLMESLRLALESRTLWRFIGRGITGKAPILHDRAITSEHDWGGLYTVLTYDGESGHAITVCGWDASKQGFIYHDPWPGLSLLCYGNNAAGVSAYPYLNQRSERLWLITRAELEQVVHAYTMPLRQWTNLLRDL